MVITPFWLEFSSFPAVGGTGGLRSPKTTPPPKNEGTQRHCKDLHPAASSQGASLCPDSLGRGSLRFLSFPVLGELRLDLQHRLVLQGGLRDTWDSTPAWMLQVLFLPQLHTRGKEAGPGAPVAPPTFSEWGDFLGAFPLLFLTS